MVKHVYLYGVGAASRIELDRDFVPRKLSWLPFFLEGVDCLSGTRGKWTCKRARVQNFVSKAGSIDLALTFQAIGGAADYLTRQTQHAPIETLFLIVKSTDAEKVLLVEAWQGNVLREEFYVEGLSVFNDIPAHKIRRLIVNELVLWHRYVGFSAMSEKTISLLVGEILSLRHSLGAQLLYLVHDYYSMCPRYTLLTGEYKYCRREITGEFCDACVELGSEGMARFSPGMNVEMWRNSFRLLLAEANEVRTFSEDSALRMNAVFPGVKITCVPHQPLCMFARKPVIQQNGTTVGVFGNVSRLKGSKEVVHLANFLISKKQSDARVVVVGDLPEIGEVLPPNLKVLGHYERESLPEIVEREGINVAFCSSICPETFSYVIQELMFLGLPIVCFDLGAQRERVVKYEKGRVVAEMTSDAVWNAIVSLRDS